MKNKILFLLFILISSFAHAQILKPVKWSIATKKINEQEFEIIYTAKIETGWHLYSQFVKPDGPTPTSFNLEESTEYVQIGKVTEEKGHVEYDKTFKMEIKYFKDKAVFKQKIKKKKNGKINIVGEIDFMSCNDDSCIPDSFDIDIEI